MDIIKTLDEFYIEAEKSMRSFNDFANKYDLQGKTRADHICYKCESKESFDFIRTLLESTSEYIYQSIISGRRIAYIKLKRGINTALGEINFLELSDQKPDNSQKNGFDHVEVFPTSLTYHAMIAILEWSESVIKVERPHHTTHDIKLDDGFIFRCTHGPLIEKIKTEML
ncbi:MAG: hypothetical protein G01um101413_85 [Parcubacteria group bacterium Gr01-1014_13]|nr:MAG: hypothetical protein G01um101413_85 [Parcubacteria group bacterium Gr01-1014_13]